MTTKGLLTAFVVLAAGAVLSGGVYWALLNVPESNVLALLLSGVLVVLIAAISACTVGVATGVVRGSGLVEALRGAHRSLAGFVAGAVVFTVLWWITTLVDTQWANHRGEIDALFLRYAGTANTSWLHSASSWLMWLIRWDIGLLAVIGAIAASYARRSVIQGLSTAFDVLPFIMCTAALIAGYWLWKVTYWRPATVSPGTAELMFVGAKLGLLAGLGLLLATLVVQAVARVADSPRKA